MPEEYVRILEIVYERGCVPVEDVASAIGRDVSSLMRVLGELEFRGLIRTLRSSVRFVELSDEGLNYAEVGLPELRLLSYVKEKFGSDVHEVPLDLFLQCCREMFSEKMCSIILSNLVRSGLCRVNGRAVKFLGTVNEALERVLRKQRVLEKLKNEGVVEVSSIPTDVLQEFQKRRLVRIRERARIVIELTDLGRRLMSEKKIVPAKIVTALTPEILRSGEWSRVILKEFDLNIEVPEAEVSVPHFMREFLEIVRDIFVELGFEEAHGPICEIEFWNFDALFQAQDHPAREVHDTFFIKHPILGSPPPDEIMEKVGRVHEDGWETGSRGWRYRWSPERALRLILRTQTTAVTVRALYERGEGEYRVFTIGKVFRPETLDPKHAMEFYQADGIVVGRNVRFRHLLSILETFVRKLGIERVRFKPAYFPFTCPSAEGYIWHERLGWVEFVGCGVFRPEVTYPAGVRESRVLAFGMGLDRLAMTILEIDDIRYIHAGDVDKLKECYSKLIRKMKTIRS
ncbi:MAG: phenylalanine--tRNA ligase subunit alpha [Crenarchaeota archaeon]|nr:phenylalanine--tRNA ligase subunit alpha [Thermoproteota archaeon]